MKQVKVNLQLNSKASSGTFSIPECWDEVPPAVYPLLAQIYLTEIEDTDRTLLAFKLLSWVPGKQHGIHEQLIAEELYDLLPLIDWVFVKMDLKKNLVPKLEIKNEGKRKLPLLPKSAIILIGPEDGLKNIRFAEWVCADTSFIEYSLDKNVDSLNSLISAIYRPQGKGDDFTPGKPTYRGDTREKFNDALVEHRAMIIARIPLFIKEAIALWFASCRWQLKTAYPQVFDPEEGDADKNPMLAGDGWFGIYDDLRGDPKFGGPDKLEEEYIHTIFQSLTRSHYKMKALKKEYDL